MKAIVTEIVDGINLTASHYVPMGKEKAIEAMKKDGIAKTFEKDDQWLDFAFGKMEAAYNKATKKEEKQDSADQKEAARTAVEANKAESGLSK
jgi:hypothetical protein